MAFRPQRLSHVCCFVFSSHLDSHTRCCSLHYYYVFQSSDIPCGETTPTTVGLTDHTQHLYSYIRTRSRAFQLSAKSREQFIRHSDRHHPRLNYSGNMASAPFLLVEFLRSVNLRGCPIWGCVDSHPSRRVDQAVPEKAAIPHGIRKV